MSNLRSRLIVALSEEAAFRYISRLGNSAISQLAPTSKTLAAFLPSFAEGQSLRDLIDLLLLTSQSSIDFFEKTLSRILRELYHVVGTSADNVGPGPRGSVNWARTRIAHRTSTLPFDRYFANIPQKRYSVAENRLLKLFLTDSVKDAERLSRSFPSGPLHDLLRKVVDNAGAALRNSYLSSVETAGEYELGACNKASKARHSGYKLLGLLSTARRRARDFSECSEWSLLADLVGNRLFEPIDDDHLFELFTLVRTLATIHSLLGSRSLESLSLLTRGRNGEIARFSDENGLSVKVFFDNSPFDILDKESTAHAILSRYPSLTYRPRRPDITVLKAHHDGSSTVLFIECKHSSNKSYVSDGLYKIFGYLFDISSASMSNTNFAAILSVPHLQDEPSVVHNVVLANPETDWYLATVRTLLSTAPDTKR